MRSPESGASGAGAPTFSTRAWIRAWVRTAVVGTALLVFIFAGYEVVERFFLAGRLRTEQLFALHIWRGMSASVLLGTWSVYNVWRARREYDAAYARAYRVLEQAMQERTRVLGRTQAFTERLFDALRDRLVVLDGMGRVVKANRVALEALHGEDPRGKPCSQFGKACDAACIAKIAFNTRKPVVGQVVRTDPATGRIFCVDAYPVPDPDGGQQLIIESARDITESKNLEAQIRYQEKFAALGVLASGIAHDIGNPLSSMSSELEMLERETDLAAVRESVGVLRGQVARITRIVREMQDFSCRRGEEVSAVSIPLAIEDALRMVRHDPRARKVRVLADVPPGLPELNGVEDHLVMVLVNLIINAFDAMPEGGELTVRASPAPGGASIEVIDTGTGMTEEVRRRALEPLFTTKGRGRGTGLGLSVSADILKSMGGSLEIESAPGAGTTVRLIVPARAAAAPRRGHA
ncbi:MAG: PAS domain-containing protein [Polyangiaceae bacterium]|nr:PAS domain-containing protein [Polyangiaceae bacterium]